MRKTIKLILPFFALNLILGIGFIFYQNNTSSAVADTLQLDEQTATIRAIAKAKPAVVSIMVYEKEKRVTMDVINRTRQITEEKVLKGSGSGFLISSNGWILTNKHVVEAGSGIAGTEYKVVLNDKRVYQAILLGKDPFNDLAILRILGKDFPYLELTEDSDLPIGSSALAIGNVLGKYQNSVTKGIISGLGRSITASDNKGGSVNLDNVIQTDAEINQGNSGGPLINLDGKVVGVNVAVDNSGSSIGFAIPANDIRPVINSVFNHGRIIRPWMGVRYVMLTPDLVEEKKLSRKTGALLTKSEIGEYAVAVNSPAGKADLREGDIIFEINGQELNDDNTLFAITQKYEPGASLKMKVQRGKDILEKIVVLEEYKP